VANAPNRLRIDLLCIGALTVLTLAAYWPVLQNDFVNFDDDLYVTKNHRVQEGLSWRNVAWAFTTRDAANWHPLTWLSHMADCQRYGMNAAGHHATSLLFHVANSLLLFWLLRRTTGARGRSLFVAVLFAIHPLHVESVAWIAERKDMLSTFFGMLALLAYARYAEGPNLRRWFLVAVLLTLGLMAKPMLVTLPFLLLLMDVWPLERVPAESRLKAFATTHRRLVTEKLPLFALAGASIAVTVLAQESGGAVGSLERFPLLPRMANACMAYLVYIWQMLLPAHLAVFYPYPQTAHAAWLALAALGVLVGVTALVLLWMKRRPFLAVGWLWFVGTLAPVIGIVQIGEQAYADRYTYIPLIGLFVMAAWAVPDLVPQRRFSRFALRGVAGLAIAALTVATWFQVGHWRDSEQLWRRAVEATSNNEMAHIKLGNALNEQGKVEEAVAQYREALRVKPDSARAYNNLAMIRLNQGDFQEALRLLSEALRISPNHVDAHVNMGIALASLNRPGEAIAHFAAALQLDPGRADAHYNLGAALFLQGEYARAAAHFAEAVRVNPLDIDARFALAVALIHLNKPEQAATHLDEVLRRRPDHAEARQYLDQLRK